jgi:hypothetical protein
MAVILNASTSSGFVQSADTSGEINLQSNGTTKLTVASTGVSGTLVQGTAVTASGTAVEFTGIPSWAKKITVTIAGLSGSGTENFWIQLGSTTYTTSGYIGSCTYISAAVTNSSSFVIANGNAAANSTSGIITIALQNGNTWCETGFVNNAAGSRPCSSAGYVALAGALDRLKVMTASTDTFDLGSLNIQYEG